MPRAPLAAHGVVPPGLRRAHALGPWWARGFGLVTLLLLALLAACAPQAGSTPQAPQPVVLAQVQGPITTTTADYLRRALNTALRRQAQLVVVQLDTPGGALEPTQAIVELFRNSPVPVVVYIAPRGAMAGSAGVLLTLAAQRAYMAPETVIGAATPITMGNADDPTLQAKITNILAAQAQALAQRRGPRAAQLAVAMVREAQAVTAAEAAQQGLVDGLAPDLDALLRALDGQTLTTVQGPTTLHTGEAPRLTVTASPIERLLALLTHPNIVLLLLSVGVQLIIIEFYSPGGWVAGTLGAIALGLGLYGVGILPSNGLGLGLIGLAFVLFVLELKAPTHGALAATGVVLFVSGAWVLFNTPLSLPQQRLSPWWAGLLAVGMAGASWLGWRVVRQAAHLPVLTGSEAAQRLVGRVGQAQTAVGPRGRGSVHIAGETWSAVLAPGAQPVSAGQFVRVVGQRGLVLVVQGLGEPAPRKTDPAAEAQA